MSDLLCELVTVGELKKHENADSLSITKVYDFPIITKSGGLKTGDRAIYFGVDTVVPIHDAFKFLWTGPDGVVDPAPKIRHRRIKAKKLRNIFSMGLLLPAELFESELGPTWKDLPDGYNVAEVLNVTKYEPEEAAGEPGTTNARSAKIPLNRWEELKEKYMPKWMKVLFWRITGHNPVRYLKTPDWFIKYTDIENIRKYGSCFDIGEELVVLEKVHGSNARMAYYKNRFWIGSRNCMLTPEGDSAWHEAAKDLNLKERLKDFPGFIFFGEVYGRTQRGDGYDYGIGNAAKFVLFDIYDISQKCYLDYGSMTLIAAPMGLPVVPELGRVIWNGSVDNLTTFADGATVLGKTANHPREGYVVRPLRERVHPRLGRVILKIHGESFLLGKRGKT